jgi:FkbM family methyltransferase
MLQKVTTLFKSMSLKDFLGTALVKVALPHTKLSYSQFGEDIVANLFFYGQQKGFYVDVGCNHPKNKNNTYLLYQKGWNGINIDGNSELIKKYRQLRKRDINLNCLVSNEEREVVFHVSTNSHVSTIDDQYLNNPANTWNYPEDKKVIMRTKTLNSILEEYPVPNDKIDLLTVDVEGHDLMVLKSIDLQKYQPSLIIVEMHDFNIENADSYEVYIYLKKHHYHLKYYSVVNGYFTREPEAGTR